jgi:hypothetical protein
MTVINAFHPDYVKTYMPQFLTDLRTESRQTAAGQTLSNYVEETRKQKPMHGTLSGISKKQVSMKPLEFMYYSRAGTKNTTAKKKETT